jgi:hypothetical protein
MRSTLKITLAALSAVVLINASCQKTAVTPAKSNASANTLAIAKQIGINFYQSVTGQHGGANIGDGIKAPSGVVPNPTSLRINGFTGEPYCGLTIDTTLNFDRQVGDTLKNVDSRYKFIYTCSTSALDGYVLSDSITYTDKGPLFFNKWITGQNYIVTKSSADFSTVLMRGTIGTNYYTSTVNGATTTAYNRALTQYSLNNLTVKVSGASPDITAGTATYNANITYLEDGNTVTGGFTGSITFIGDHKARMVITYQGVTTTYSFDLITYNLTVI